MWCIKRFDSYSFKNDINCLCRVKTFFFQEKAKNPNDHNNIYVLNVSSKPDFNFTSFIKILLLEECFSFHIVLVNII